MRWILCLMMLVSLGFAPAPVYRPKPDPAADDLALLQGKWLRTMQKFDDKPAAPDNNTIVAFEKSAFIFPAIRYQITLDIGEGKRFMYLQDNNKPKAYVALYRISGDELILCFSQKNGVLPQSMDGGPGMYIYTFKRGPKP